MSRKLLIVLALIVLLPIVALGWLGYRFSAAEQQAVQHRVQSLIDAQLSEIDAALAAYFEAQQSELLSTARQLPLTTSDLRDYVQRTHLVRQVFIMDAKGERMHPPRAAALTESEESFLLRSFDIWRNRDILYQTGAASAEASQAAKKMPPPYGWYVWHWGAETDLIFWMRDSDKLIGFELQPARVMADLIGLLPASGEDRLGQARAQLSDDRGRVLYQWGGWQPGSDDKALAVRPLSHPLGTWKLSYFAPPLAHQGATRNLVLAATLAALAVALGALGYYLYREHTRAAHLAQSRVNFVNQVSHELKTPLTNIRMYAEMLGDELEDSATSKSRRYLDIILGESQRLSRLILNVLNFARLQRERLQLHRKAGCVDDVVRAAIAAFAPALEAKGVRVELSANAPATVSLDADALEQILNNLLGNVEKYAAAGERVSITTAQDDNMTRITVRDYGPGIPPREREHVFAPFYRIDDKLTEGASGTGIGLTIARELARLHGGDLRLVDLSAGESGACFEVTLSTATSEGT